MTIGPIRARAALAVATAVAAGAGATASPASAATCSVNAAAGTVTVQNGPATVRRGSGGAILVNGAACGSATVTSVDTIEYAGSFGADTFTIDLGGGPFAPGRTAEASGISEIELRVDGMGTFPPLEDALSINGGAGADAIRFGAAGVALNADADADVAVANVHRLIADGRSGGDQLLGDGGNGAGGPANLPLRLAGGTGDDTLQGGDVDDTLDGGADDDTERGGGGTDTFRQGAAANGADVLDGGGTPFDAVDYSQRAAAVKADLDGAPNDGAAGELDNVLNSIEYVHGGSGSDTLRASQTLYASVELYGNGGNDVMTGGSSGDLLEGGPGSDTLSGNDGSDTFFAGAGNDTSRGGDDDDRFYESHPSAGTSAPGANGADEILGGLGSDLVALEHRESALTITLADGEPNDGATDEGDNFHPDVEEVRAGLADDSVTGTGAKNRFTGGAGADQLLGAGGDDVLGGGPDDDELDGSTGADDLDGDDGDDLLAGGSGADRLVGDYDDDHLDAGTGADHVFGQHGHDVMPQPAARDEADELDGGDGTDLVSYAARTARVKVSVNGIADDGGTAGTSEGDDVSAENLTGGGADDELTGDGGANVLIGGGGPDDLHGLGGPDRMDGGAGAADDLHGGDGRDVADYSARTAPLTIRLNNGIADDGATSEGDRVESTEDVIGGTAADRLTGDGGLNALDGRAGDDTLDGGLGADVLTGGPDTDVADYGKRTTSVATRIDGAANDGADANANGVGEEGDNVGATVENVQGGSGDDWLRGGGTANRLRGGAGDDRLGADAGADVLEGQTGRDTADYGGRTTPVAISLDADADDGGDANADGIAEEGDRVATDVEVAQGGFAGDRLSGSSAANELRGGGGGDVLDATDAGADVLRGGTNKDTVTYAGRPASQKLEVSIDGVANDGTAGVGVDNVALDVESLIGHAGADVLRGSGGDNVLLGGLGADEVYGGAGEDVLQEPDFSANDVLNGGTGRDVADYTARTATVTVNLDDVANDGAATEKDDVRTDVESVAAGFGDDWLYGSAGADHLIGHAGRDRLYGRGGEDELSGMSGPDTLHGEDSNDELDGGDGDDTFLGGRGNDTLDAGPAPLGTDTLDGGEGQDTADYSKRAIGVAISNGGVAENVYDHDGEDADGNRIAEERDEIAADVEVLRGGSGADKVRNESTVDDGCAINYGGPGNDRLYAAVEATTTLFGEGDHDLLFGGGDADFLVGGPGQDKEDGFGGDDRFIQGEMTVGCPGFAFGSITGGDGPDILFGQHGEDTVEYLRTDPVLVRIDEHAGDGAAGGNEGDTVVAENVAGGSGSDQIYGDGADNKLYGWGGDDLLDGGAGHDRLEDPSGVGQLFGGTGNDTFAAADGDNADTLDGGDGTDGGQWDAGDTRIEIP